VFLKGGFMDLKEVDGVEVVSLVDNSIDFASSVERNDVKNVHEQMIKYPKPSKGRSRYLFAEHGFSMLIRTYLNGKSHTVLFDTGSSGSVILHNIRVMGFNLKEVEAIILSHGHYDHFGGLLKIIRAAGKKEFPVIVHGDAFKPRGVKISDGSIIRDPAFPKEDQIKPSKFVVTKKPYLLAEDTIMATGEIPRETEFETGFPRQYAFIDGRWRLDPLILDDQALVINVKKKGLIILSGCAHAGIVNTIIYAQQLTGTHVHAILGGFHLAGKDFEPRINRTIKFLIKVKPAIIAPAHCTGWRATQAIAKTMRQAFIYNSVGNIYNI
jgi:7,8-dihydropterin-6-yl-methyl-4-(beta-D-ribofuranosyl)aminobenzene 5'-phosphate synthase